MDQVTRVRLVIMSVRTFIIHSTRFLHTTGVVDVSPFRYLIFLKFNLIYFIYDNAHPFVRTDGHLLSCVSEVISSFHIYRLLINSSFDLNRYFSSIPSLSEESINIKSDGP